MCAENLWKGVLYKDIVGQRVDPDLTSTWPTLARPHGSEEVRVWGQASSGKGRPRQVRGQRKHAVTWPDPTFEDTRWETRLVTSRYLSDGRELDKYSLTPLGVRALQRKLNLLLTLFWYPLFTCVFRLFRFLRLLLYAVPNTLRHSSSLLPCNKITVLRRTLREVWLGSTMYD